MEFTTGEEAEVKEVGKKVFTGEEISKQLDRLMQDKANNQRIRDWVEVCVTILVIICVFRLEHSTQSFFQTQKSHE